jgi:hypothetical protein
VIRQIIMYKYKYLHTYSEENFKVYFLRLNNYKKDMIRDIYIYLYVYKYFNMYMHIYIYISCERKNIQNMFLETEKYKKNII